MRGSSLEGTETLTDTNGPAK